jgi:hypothetical protein
VEEWGRRDESGSDEILKGNERFGKKDGELMIGENIFIGLDGMGP